MFGEFRISSPTWFSDNALHGHEYDTWCFLLDFTCFGDHAIQKGIEFYTFDIISKMLLFLGFSILPKFGVFTKWS